MGEKHLAEQPEQPYLSVVLPVFNEAQILPELHRRLVATLDQLGRSFELLFIDDGSRDNSKQELDRLAAKDPRVRALSFSRNFGHHLAITAGLDHAQGEVVVLMDSDLQDQPEFIPALLAKLDEGYDMVYAQREDKKFSPLKRALSSGFRWTMANFANFELAGGIFRALRRPIVDEVRRCREADRLIGGLLSWTGFRSVGIPVTHGERLAGESKYPLRRQLKLAVNAITSFSTLPLRVSSWIGVLLSTGAFLWIAVLFYRRLVLDKGVPGWTSLLVVMLLLGGVQLLSLGILGEYIGRIFNETRRRPLYIVQSDSARPKPASRIDGSTTPAVDQLPNPDQ